MRSYSMKFIISNIFVLLLSFFVTEVFAAKAIDLQQMPGELMQKFFISPSSIQQVSSNKDFNGVTHIRLQQFYAGYPVWGGDFIAHIPRGLSVKSINDLTTPALSSHVTYNGNVYEELQRELGAVPANVLTDTAMNKAKQAAIQLFEKKLGSKNSPSETLEKLIIFIDKHNKAHWSYFISFNTIDKNNIPAQPVYIIDAYSYAVYKSWNNIQTLEDVHGGGLGGNPKFGKIVYDNVNTQLILDVMRDTATHMCYLKNSGVMVKDARVRNEITHFDCAKFSPQHNNIYWDADFDTVNGAYSPSNDALYDGKIIKDMYQKWYGIPVLVKNGKPMMLTMVVHAKMENAYWDGTQMTFGDGGKTFYPLVSLGVGAHEISHGFTEQHSGLIYQSQSGGLNESFSDMAAQAAEYYSTGKSSWQIGAEILKGKNVSLRYMDEPTKDCESGARPGDDCSISHVKDYADYVDVHFSSGIFNKAFYLIATSEGWNTKKAFDVMVHANMNYWTANTDFNNAACGVVQAAHDYNYSVSAINKAMFAVGINTDKCSKI
ncbi:MAG: M4 family metallopeptidase [Gammaproteobacteria bacterium]|nr:M4 family metallopeptidase [Gammaproteobacteria bacterium]